MADVYRGSAERTPVEKLIDALSKSRICPEDIGLSEKVNCMPFIDCKDCYREALKPETIPDKGKEG